MADEQYKINITPLEKQDTYQASPTEVTDFVLNVGDVTRQVDDGDFDIGVFTYDNVRLRLINDTGQIQTSGRFSDANSASSIFKYKRDLNIVDLVHVARDSTETTLFTGLVNDTLTRDNLDEGYTDFVVTGRAGIFSKNAVIGGSVGDGMTVKEALESLLDRPIITNYLTYDSANINPALDVVIDVGSELDNLSYKTALDKIMLASGSVLIVDSSNNIIVKDRSDNGNTSYKFYNSGDPLGRENIVELKNYNTGVQRAFNLYKIDKTVARDNNLIAEYGLREKSIDVAEIITNTTTRGEIVDYYLENFSIPKQEFDLLLTIDQAADVELLDLCQVDYRPILLEPNSGEGYSFPSNTPRSLNKRYVSGNIGFKVIAKSINVSGYSVTLKLREIGNKAGDSIV